MRSNICLNAILLILPVFLTVASCRQAPVKDKKPRISEEEKKEMLLRINKFLVKKDVELIESYADRMGWEMQWSQTGLYYDIYEHAEGSMASSGMVVSINYRVSLLDGTVCYSSDRDGIKTFRLGRGEEISGLEQGIEMMREGEKARFIIPPHLAYGLLGDEKRIPARSIILYEVELLRAGEPLS